MSLVVTAVSAILAHVSLLGGADDAQRGGTHDLMAVHEQATNSVLEGRLAPEGFGLHDLLRERDRRVRAVQVLHGVVSGGEVVADVHGEARDATDLGGAEHAVTSGAGVNELGFLEDVRVTLGAYGSPAAFTRHVRLVED